MFHLEKYIDSVSFFRMKLHQFRDEFQVRFSVTDKQQNRFVLEKVY